MAKKKINFNFSNLTALLLLGVVIVLAGVLFSQFDRATTSPKPDNNLKLYFFANSGSGTFVKKPNEDDTYTLGLYSVAPRIAYVSRNPDNYFGKIRLSGFLNTVWGEDSTYKFSENPPNATLIVYNPEKNREEILEVELSNPNYTGQTLEFTATKVDAQSRVVKSFFDDNTTDFPEEFTNPTLVFDLSKSDVNANMLEVLTVSQSPDTQN